jgi:hypothetical protein
LNSGLRPERLPVLASLLATYLWLAPAASPQTCSGPGHERWPIKTSLPAAADLTNTKRVALNDLLSLAPAPGVKHNDARYADARIPAFGNSLNVKEGDLLTTTGWLYLVATEDNDCDYHIQISPVSQTTTKKPTASDDCLIVEAPKPDFVDNADLKQALITLRSYISTKLLRGKEPANRGSVMIHAVCVRVAGQLFYDDAHVKTNGEPELRGRRGMQSHTLWELHPINSFVIAPASSCPAA